MTGLIPAHAGKTTDSGEGVRAQGAHPRSRGENFCRLRPGPIVLGSSPLTRGKPCPGLADGRAAGLIPAHAGKTLRQPCMLASPRAHPRSRGENVIRSCMRRSWLGSSPLTRGKPLIERSPRLAFGLIPAHAGKTRSIWFSMTASRAHPRSRGENVTSMSSARHAPGSSPLTRGKPLDAGCSRRPAGLIPAHAGKTRTGTGRSGRASAHPRSRGENTSPPSSSIAQSGSSPLTRGKLESCSTRHTALRLIPAHAGKTLPSPS